jgi:hypothetical protein
MLGEIIGGLTGQEHSQAAGDAQKAAINQMIAKLDAVGMPPDQSAKLILDQYRQAGILTPDLMNQVQQQTSQFAQLKTNQPTLDVQMQALQRMSQLGQAGLTADERSQQRLLQQQNQQANNANQQSIIQNMAARGIQGGGAEIASRLGASQNAANQGSSAADQVSAMAQQRALQAIAQSGGMAGQINQQQFGQQATIAGAQDQMNRFNVQNQMAINQQNVNTQNQAQAANLANAQQISNANVGATNQEQYDQLARQRQLWQEKMQYAGAYAAPLQAYGQAGYGQEMSKAKMDAGLGQAMDQTAFNIAGMFMGQAPKQTTGTGVGDQSGQNQGQGPTQSNYNQMSSGSGEVGGGNYYGTTSYGSGGGGF